VLLVGHSYGGAVITAAGAADNVAGLVYVAAFAPDELSAHGRRSGYGASPPSQTMKPWLRLSTCT
jgi:pimeloyl-ACP methyl ester carboxylesterase